MSDPGTQGRPRPRVLIVDDHQLFRAGVRAELEPLLEIAGEASGVDDALDAIETQSPDVVLLDVHMPYGGGVEVIRRAATLMETPPCFLALSVSDAAEDVIAVIRAGARGYVTKSISGEELADAVPADRRGVRESIVGRMERHGGRTRITSAPGSGTEVEIVLEERA